MLQFGIMFSKGVNAVNYKEIERILQSRKKYIEEKYNVKSLGIFGSYVRGEATENSDVDILVEYREAPDLISFVELKHYLSDLLNTKVDLVMKNTLKPNIGKEILKEAVYL